MAVHIETKKVCDICSPPTTAGRTVVFSYGPERREIELCDNHDRQLEEMLTPYIRASRKLGAKPRTLGRQRAGTPAVRDYTPAEVREWAKRKGYKVSDDPTRRISPAIIAKFRKEALDQAS